MMYGCGGKVRRQEEGGGTTCVSRCNNARREWEMGDDGVGQVGYDELNGNGSCGIRIRIRGRSRVRGGKSTVSSVSVE